MKYSLCKMLLCVPLLACAGGPQLATLAAEHADAAIERWPLAAGTLSLTREGLHWHTHDEQFNLPGAFESLDVRAPFAAALAEGGHQLLLLELNEQGLHLRTRVELPDQLGDAQCLYLSAQSNHLYSFVQDSRGASQQWLLTQAQQPLDQARLVRQLPVPYGVDLCAADDARGWLYLHEEDIGLWRLPAEPEAMPARAPVLMQAPLGSLADNLEHLRTTPAGAVIASTEHQLWHLAPNNTQLDASATTAHWRLPFAPTGLVVESGAATLFSGTERHRQPLPSIASALPSVDLLPVVTARVETAPAAKSGDAMDDPAIWVNSENPAQSRVLGTHKKAGLYVYNLAGEVLQFFPDGRLNNVDVSPAHHAPNHALAVASRRDDNSLVVYTINPQGEVHKATQLGTPLREIYGLCSAYYDQQNHIFVNDKNGEVLHYTLRYRAHDTQMAAPNNQQPNPWQLQLERRFKLASQPEGCAVDTQRRILFMGEEERGIWAGDARPEAATQLELIAEVGRELHADVEGLSVATRRGDGSNLLVVSSQGNDSYLIYKTAPPYTYLGRFRVGLDGRTGIDGSSETDGLDVTSAALGNRFPGGLLVVQDGRNLMPNAGQNFKLVHWQDVLDTLQIAP